MKQLIISALAIFMIAFSAPLMANSGDLTNPVNPTNEINPEDAKKVETLTVRLDELKEMDMSVMTRVEKKEARKEIKEIKRELKALNGGIYLSAGALIVIAILLIILL